MAGCSPPGAESSGNTRAAPFSGAGGGARRSSSWSWTGGGGAAGAFPFSKFRTPACSARRKASCTRLIFFLTLPEIVVVHRAAHRDGAHDDGGGPAQPEQTALAAHQQRVLQQRYAAQHRQVGVRPDVFQVLQRSVL